MIADCLYVVQEEAALWEERRPLTFAQWAQHRRLKRAIAALEGYLLGEQPTDGYDDNAEGTFE